MCGIIGYVGCELVSPILVNSLKRLEYRGYDSCGIAISGSSIEVYKELGLVSQLEKNLPPISSHIGIGHTRWATHGEVSKRNAHPHTDCHGGIAVVHNGVIDNYLELKRSLSREGHRFNSETDTEVISHLIEKYYRGNLDEAVSLALGEIEGTYAILVLARGHDELIAARKESPLIIGIGVGGNFVASDIPAVLDHTHRIMYLEDGDIARVSAKEVRVHNKGQLAEREQQDVNYSVDEVQRAGYEHFMLKEIHEQPKVVEETCRGQMSLIRPSIQLEIDTGGDFSDIVMVACGTSYHAALVGEYIMNKVCRIPVRVKIASEFNYSETPLKGSWVIGITQSGETADTLRALKKAKENGCRTLAITNVPGSSVTRSVDQVLYTRAGLEIGVAATKTFLAQLTSLYLLSLSLATIDLMMTKSLINVMRELPAMISQVLDREPEITEHARCLSRSEHTFYIARGLNFPVALEGALKLKEISYIHAEAYPAGELKHGPFALLHPDSPVIAVATPDDTYKAMLANITEVKSRGVRVLALAEDGDETIGQLVDEVIYLPRIESVFSPFLNSVALQLLAYYTARERGCPIDKPRNLAKSVTVE